MDLLGKSSNACSIWDMPKKSYKVLPLKEKVNVLNLIRKEKSPMLSLRRFTVSMNLLSVKL